MRYIGNKENLLNIINQILIDRNIVGSRLFDFFSGTTSVAKFYKKRNVQLYTSDIMYYSYCLQHAYIKNNQSLFFSQIVSDTHHEIENIYKILTILNNLQPQQGFIYQNYSPSGTKNLEKPRMYFSDDNAMRIDAIRMHIEQWHQNNHINVHEYYYLLACLLETVSFYANVAGIYAAFSKKWDPRALKKLTLKPIESIKNNHENQIYYGDSMNILDKTPTDILYLDPPYNERQYAPNYHILETIAKYDNPIISGITGMRDYRNQKSRFCNALTAKEDLKYIAQHAQYKFLILSYNSEGIMKKEHIIEILQQYGKVECIEFDYLRYKSQSVTNHQPIHSKHIKEQLFICIKN